MIYVKERRNAIIYAVIFFVLVDVQLLVAQDRACSEDLRLLMDKAQGAEDVYDWTLAITLYEKVVRIGEKEGRSLCVSRGHSGVARVYARVGDFVYGLDKRYSDQLPEDVFFKDIDLYEEAKKEYKLAAMIARKIGNREQALRGDLGYALVQGQLRNTLNALKLFNKIDSSLTNDFDKGQQDLYYRYRPWILNARGLAHYRLAEERLDTLQLSLAVSDLKKAEGVIKTKEDQFDLIDVYQNLGMSFRWLAKYDSSLMYYRMSLEQVKQQSNLSGGSLLFEESRSWHGLSLAFEGIGRPDSALYYFKMYDKSHDGLASDEQVRSVRQFLVFFDTERNQARIREQRLMIVISIAIILLLTTLAVYVIYKRKSQKKMSDQRIDDLLQQQEISALQGVLEGQEEERQRIASDLHDKLGSILGMVKLHFSAVEEKIDILRDDNRKQYDKASQLLDEANVELRNISHDLMSGVLAKFGLIPALLDLKDKIEATGTVNVSVENQGVKNQLSRDQELQLYRIFQELMSNTLKHAKAKNIIILLKVENSQFSATYQDDGIGFDFEEAKKRGGMGLKNIEARVQRLNAIAHYKKESKGDFEIKMDVNKKP